MERDLGHVPAVVCVQSLLAGGSSWLPCRARDPCGAALRAGLVVELQATMVARQHLCAELGTSGALGREGGHLCLEGGVEVFTSVVTVTVSWKN